MGNCSLCQNRVEKNYQAPDEDMTLEELAVLKKYNYAGSEVQRDYFYNNQYNTPNKEKKSITIKPLALNATPRNCEESDDHDHQLDSYRSDSDDKSHSSFDLDDDEKSANNHYKKSKSIMKLYTSMDS